MTETTAIQERRIAARKKVKITFLFKIGKLFSGRGFAKDINLQGIRLSCPALFKPRRTMMAKDYIGSTLNVMIPSANITVHGVVAWVNLKNGEGAIRIKSTSDDLRWKELCVDEQPAGSDVAGNLTESS